MKVLCNTCRSLIDASRGSIKRVYSTGSEVSKAMPSEVHHFKYKIHHFKYKSHHFKYKSHHFTAALRPDRGVVLRVSVYQNQPDNSRKSVEKQSKNQNQPENSRKTVEKQSKNSRKSHQVANALPVVDDRDLVRVLHIDAVRVQYYNTNSIILNTNSIILHTNSIILHTKFIILMHCFIESHAFQGQFLHPSTFVLDFQDDSERLLCVAKGKIQAC